MILPSGSRSTSELSRIGVNRTGNGIPTSGWPDGSGYTHYKWRLDSGAWSAETPIAMPIALTSLADGAHRVEVSGKRDSGLYQDDPVFGLGAVVTVSRTWMVQTSVAPLRIDSAERLGNSVVLSFVAHAGVTYTVQCRDGLEASQVWIKVTDVAAQTTTGPINVTDANANASGMRFYRLVTPATP